jgi:hypothetical protein
VFEGSNIALLTQSQFLPDTVEDITCATRLLVALSGVLNICQEHVSCQVACCLRKLKLLH